MHAVQVVSHLRRHAAPSAMAFSTPSLCRNRSAKLVSGRRDPVLKILRGIDVTRGRPGIYRTVRPESPMAARSGISAAPPLAFAFPVHA
jgi:hypothetical protein